jgi:adenylate kinase family enzyme
MDVLRIVIASPGSDARSGDTVDGVVSELNATVALERGIHLQTVRCDTDACFGLPVDGPRALIDTVLRIEDCDCLVALFWNRFGAQVTTELQRASTAIDFLVEPRHGTCNAEVLVYLSDVPFVPQSAAEARSWKQVCAFKAENPAGDWWWGYSDEMMLRRLVRSQLTAWLERVRVPGRGVPSTEELPHRLEYIKRFRELIEGARVRIEICTSKVHRSDAFLEAADLNRALRDARRRGVEIQVLQSGGFDRLAGALELSVECGVEVRFDPDLPAVDISFACVDQQCSIVARREASQDPASYKRSTAWTVFRSTYLTAILRREFQARWTAFGVRSIALLFRELLPAAVDELGAAAVARQLHATHESVVALRYPLPVIVFMMGRPGSGKTTIAKAMIEGLQKASVPYEIAYVSDLAFVRKTFEDPAAAAARAVRTEDGGWFITDPGLYDEALINLAEQVESHRDTADIVIVEFARRDYGTACRLLQQQGVDADVLVYLDVPFATAVRRNELRFRAGTGHFVSEREMRETYQYDDVSVLRTQPAFCLLPNDELQLGGAERAARVVFDGIRKIAPAIRMV